MAHAYLMHRLSSPAPDPRDTGHRRRPIEEPAPVRWLRDLGLDEPGFHGRRGVRASDADREHTVSLLKRHTAEGRLSTDELTSRVEAAYTAKSLAELDALTADLPELLEPAPTHSRPRARGLAPAAHAGAIGVGLLVLVGLLSLLAPPEVWASLFLLFIPLAAIAVVSILPFALPVVVLLMLARGAHRPARLQRAHSHSVLPLGRRSGVHVWRL